jgi:glucose-1-phosphate adenylyltransferase
MQGCNYRLIDIPVSNCINSDINKIYCLTQFNSASLNRHLSSAYNSNVGSYTRQGFVEVLAAQQSPENPDWFQGTADAVRQYLWLFKVRDADTAERGVRGGNITARIASISCADGREGLRL